MFLLSASGRVFSTKVALVSIGANVIDERFMRYPHYRLQPRLAYYRSYRDPFSRDAMRQMGLDVSGDAVYPDVVFSLPESANSSGDSKECRHRHYGLLRPERRSAAGRRDSLLVHCRRSPASHCGLWTEGRPIRLITSDPMADDKIIRAILDVLAGAAPGARARRRSLPSRSPVSVTSCGRRRWSTPSSPLGITTSSAP